MQIHTIDLLHQNVSQAIASYVVLGSSDPILVETGPGSTVKTAVAELDKLGLKPSDIKHVFITHIHFDHAGAAGWWAKQGAQIYMHPVGAPHMIDPSRLIASATRIYGDMMETLWGELIPIPEEQVTILQDGDVVEIGDVTIRAIDTPGHAFHHHAYAVGDIAFTGDVGGSYFKLGNLLDMPAPPPEFHLAKWLESLDKLIAEGFTAVYPTHFGRVDDAHTHLTSYRQLLEDTALFVRDKMEEGLEADAVAQAYVARQTERALQVGMTEQMVKMYEVVGGWEPSAYGMMRYWRKAGVNSK